MKVIHFLAGGLFGGYFGIAIAIGIKEENTTLILLALILFSGVVWLKLTPKDYK